ncbi:hypothetical protein [Maricaulis sp.]|uniref:hypothetical protein n=1 Tax=Maricaulis sp. TaxID=1486257 RepID=UPI003A941BCD
MRISTLFAAAVISLAASGCSTTSADRHHYHPAAHANAMQLNVDARAVVEWDAALNGRNYTQRQVTSMEVGGGQTVSLEFADLPPEVFDPAALGGETIDLTVTVLTTVLGNGDVLHAVTLETVGAESGTREIIAQPSLTAAQGETSTIHIGTEAPGQLESGFTMDLVASRIE